MDPIKYFATLFLVCAVVHTFAANAIIERSHRYPSGSITANLLHFLGEVEVVFGIWAALLIGVISVHSGLDGATEYLEEINFTEPAFVFVIMCMAATRPVLLLVERIIALIARLLPIGQTTAIYCTSLILGPLLGSLITEPAAMTVTALLVKSFFTPSSSLRFRYATLGLLFVNISIGGTLTHFAAPPVLMVATPWQWTTAYMAANFGWKAAIAITTGTIATAVLFRAELQAAATPAQVKDKVPAWVMGVHILFLALTIINAHHMVFFLPLFLFFLSWCSISKAYQDDIRIKESLLVGFFLGGLVTLGKLQDWWLQPLLSSLGDRPLFWGAMVLTAITDNAALTYLGTLVPGLTDSAKYALVAGAVSGGGLTVIANAPNPAGYGLLRECFGEDGISPVGLLLGALPYSILAAAAYLLL